MLILYKTFTLNVIQTQNKIINLRKTSRDSMYTNLHIFITFVHIKNSIELYIDMRCYKCTIIV